MATTYTLLALDPGPVLTAWVELRDGKPAAFGHEPNPVVLERVRWWDGPLAIEMIASYGMAVGAEVFGTCVWIGRFDMLWSYGRMQAEPRVRSRSATLVERGKIKMHHCRSMRANDSNIRAALIDRFGGKAAALGTKDNPGALRGISGDVWAALALALYLHDIEAAL